MKRQSDSYLNATQILKTAGVDKGRRTKILEREILSGEHEKVQGGYGKYQGTWVPFQRGVEFCTRYGVAELLRPLLEFDPSNPVQASALQTKDEALSAHRKFKAASNSNNGNYSQLPSTPFGPPLMLSAAYSTPDHNHRQLQTMTTPMQNGYPNHQYQTFEVGPTSAQLSRAADQAQNAIAADHPDHPPSSFQNAMSMPPPISPVKQQQPQQQSLLSQSPAQVYANLHDQDDSDTFVSLPPLTPDQVTNWDKSREFMMNIFLENEIDEPASILRSDDTVLDVDVPIDEFSHTALHWAATLGRISTVIALLDRSAEPKRTNAARGECTYSSSPSNEQS